MPAFFADVLISVLASSISARTSVDMSAIALCTSVPMEGSSVPVGRLDAALWATAGSSLIDGGLDMIVPDARRWRAPRSGEAEWPGSDTAPRPLHSILGGRARQLLLDQVHDRGVGERGDVAHLAVLRDVAQQPPHDLARAGLGQLLHDHDLPRAGDG